MGATPISRVRRAKLAMYQAAKRIGLFDQSRRITARQLRILCFHGIALEDEQVFRPTLFMRPEVLTRRMRFLAQQRYPVVSLDDAMRGLREGTLPDAATVITFDDGFYNNLALAQPIIEQFRFPWTVYVTSYYATKETPVFRLVVQYCFAMTLRATMDLNELVPALQGQLDLRDNTLRDRAMWQLIEHGESKLDETERVQLSRRIAERLDLSYDRIVEKRLFSLMTLEEIRQIAAQGVNIQLHTHRHRLPQHPAEVKREIDDNRAVLEPLIGRSLHHLCYPSGIWDRSCWPWLEELDIRSATTCDNGLNTPASYPLALSRFLDGENVTQIEFEAEISGFAELMRSKMRRMRPSHAPTLPG